MAEARSETIIVVEDVDGGETGGVANMCPRSSESDSGSALGLQDATGGIIPSLRVEQLKDEGSISSSPYTTEDDLSDSDIVQRLGDFVPPNDELTEKIVKQIEFYFSDANILKDAFLLKHVRKNREGFINLKLITSFKKMKSLTKDYRVVAHSVKALSTQLVVSGNKVRRALPLPEWDESTPSRTVVAVNLPVAPSIGAVEELFSSCGNILLIRLLRPERPLPPDVKKYAKRHPELGVVYCAVIEFEEFEGARKACDKSSGSKDGNWRTSMRVFMLIPNAGKKKKEESEGENEGLSGGEGEASRGPKTSSAPRTKKQRKAKVKAMASAEGYASSGSEGDFLMPTPKGGRRAHNSGGSMGGNGTNDSLGIPGGLTVNPPSFNSSAPDLNAKHASPKTSPHGSPQALRKLVDRRKSAPGRSPLADKSKITPKGSPEMKRKGYDSGSDGGGGSPWSRRLQQSQHREMSPLAKTGVSPSASPVMGRKFGSHNGLSGGIAPGDSPVVMRTPRGPDGTKGFGARLLRERAHTVGAADRSRTHTDN